MFSANPGELFVVRNVAAVVPPYGDDTGFFGTRAAIAYAVLALNVRNVVVMGHAQCGGVAAAMDPSAAGKIPFLKQWVQLLKPAVESKIPKGHNHGKHRGGARRGEGSRSSGCAGYPFIAEREQSGALVVDGLALRHRQWRARSPRPRHRRVRAVERPGLFSRWFGSGRRAASPGDIHAAAG